MAWENTLLIMPKNPSSRQHGSVATTNLRRGAFPGSFNPLTVAHLEIARLARERYDLGEVHLIVSVTALDKPNPPGPRFDERIATLEADAASTNWLVIARTEHQLIADIAEGFDVVIMGADKWVQVHDVSYYDDELDFVGDKESVASTLERAIVDAQRAIDEMRAGPDEIHHYGG